MTFKEFPPIQAPDTYNLDGILKHRVPEGRRLARQESKDAVNNK